MDVTDIVASNAGPAFALDLSGRLTAWTRGAEELFGYAASGVLGRYCWDVLSGQDAYGNAYCGSYCPLLGMAERHEAIHRTEVLFLDASGKRVRTGVSSFIVPGGAPAELTIVHFLCPVVSRNQPLNTDDGNNPRVPDPITFTAREAQVLCLMAEGAGTPEIAGELGISSATVRNHTGKILRKLKAHTRLQAVTAARQLHLIS